MCRHRYALLTSLLLGRLDLQMTASLCELRIRTEVHWDGGNHYFGSEIVDSHSHARSCWDMNDLIYGVGMMRVSRVMML